MDEFEIEVVGAKPRSRSRGRRRGIVRRALRALLMRPRAMVLAGVALFVGTPHAGWDYVCRLPMRPGEPCRSFDYCAYYGIQGRRVLFPEPGESCGVIKLVPIDWHRIM